VRFAFNITNLAGGGTEKVLLTLPMHFVQGASYQFFMI